MELTDRQRRFAFAGLVIVLAAAGIYLTMPDRRTPEPDSAASPAATPAAGAPAPAPVAPATPSPGASDFDIYPLLPFAEEEFAAAADVAQRFTSAYGTYRHDEDPKVYLGRLDQLMIPELRSEIERGATSPGLLQQRKQEQVVATSEATIESIRDIEKSSIIFLVAGKQRITRTGQSSVSDERYAVTVGKKDGGWKIHAFQPADVGQAGDTG